MEECIDTKQWQARFTPEDIRYIRKAYIGGSATNVMKLANAYGVSQETIRKIAKRRHYKWVSDMVEAS